HAVDGVDYEDELRGQLRGDILLGQKGLHRGAMTAGVDHPDPLRHDHHLGLAHAAIQGMELAVDVGNADIIQINQGNPTNAAAGQGFRRPGADPADADDADMGSRQNIQGVLAVKPLDAAETLGKMIGHGRYLCYSPCWARRQLPRRQYVCVRRVLDRFEVRQWQLFVWWS